MEDLKVGDIVEYTGLETYIEDNIKIMGQITNIYTNRDLKEGGQVWVTVISHPRISVGKRIFWYGKNCKLIQKKEEKPDILCKCSIVILMRYGCQCGKT